MKMIERILKFADNLTDEVVSVSLSFVGLMIGVLSTAAVTVSPQHTSLTGYWAYPLVLAGLLLSTYRAFWCSGGKLAWVDGALFLALAAQQFLAYHVVASNISAKEGSALTLALLGSVLLGTCYRRMLKHLTKTSEDSRQLIVSADGDCEATAPVTDEDIEFAARMAHEVNRFYCQSIGDDSQKPWAQAADWQRDSAIKGVHGVLKGNQPGDSHLSWMQDKFESGWKYGPVKDEAKKEHPCMVPFNQLPREQQVKDYLFVYVVLALLGRGVSGCPLGNSEQLHFAEQLARKVASLSERDIRKSLTGSIFFALAKAEAE